MTEPVTPCPDLQRGDTCEESALSQHALGLGSENLRHPLSHSMTSKG